MKTEQDLKDLIKSWENDPCWDIEETEGFEEYKEPLKSYRLAKEKYWEVKHELRVLEECKKYGCNEELLKLLESLQHRISILGAREP